MRSHCFTASFGAEEQRVLCTPLVIIVKDFVFVHGCLNTSSYIAFVGLRLMLFEWGFDPTFVPAGWILF